MNIKIVKRNKYNPVWFFWFKIFPNANPETTYFSFGDLIITPNGIITDELYAHELVHLEQQKNSKLHGLWWYTKYIFSQKFRLEMEIPAYGEHIKSLSKGKNWRQIETISSITYLLVKMYKIDMSHEYIYNRIKQYLETH